MTGLEDVFGESFAEKFEQERQSRINSRNRVTEESKQAIANKVVNEDALDPSEPQFQFVDENNVTHDVLLMTVPEPNDTTIWTYANSLDSGAVSMPMDYLGEWMSVLFNDSSMVEDLEMGDEVLIIGELDQWIPDGSNEPQDQVSPARGVLKIEDLKEYAEAYMHGEAEEVSEEQDEEPSTAFATQDEDDEDEDDSPTFGGSSDDSDDSGGVFSIDEEEEEEDDDFPIDYDEEELRTAVDQMIEQRPKVKELTHDDRELNDVSMAFLDHYHDVSDLDKETLSDVVETVNEDVADYLEELRSEEEEEDDDDEFFDNEDSIFG